MLVNLGRRLVALLLLTLVSVGGGSLPTVDALAFHESIGAGTDFIPHFEAGSDCHADGCSVRSVAHETRLAPLPITPTLVGVLPELSSTAAFSSVRLQADPHSSHLSRAPPLSA